MESAIFVNVNHDDDDRSALRLLYQDQYPQLCRLALLLGAPDAEDLVQDAFIRLFRHPRHLRAAHASSYLQRIVVNLTRDRARHLTLARSRSVATPVDTPAPDESVAARTSMKTALAQLSPRHREALVLRYWLDLSLKEMAASMNVSVGTAKSHLSRGLAPLRTQLGAERW